MAFSNTKRSTKQENALGKRIGGRRTPGSGSGWVTKNDVKTSDVSVEVKFTDKKSYSLKEDDLLKAERQALLDGGREFAFVVRMAGGREWVITSLEHANGKGLFDGPPDPS